MGLHTYRQVISTQCSSAGNTSATSTGALSPYTPPTTPSLGGVQYRADMCRQCAWTLLKVHVQQTSEAFLDLLGIWCVICMLMAAFWILWYMDERWRAGAVMSVLGDLCAALDQQKGPMSVPSGPLSVPSKVGQ